MRVVLKPQAMQQYLKHNTRGYTFWDFVCAVAATNRRMTRRPQSDVATLALHDPLAARVLELMRTTGTSAKFVLRKLAAAVIPRGVSIHVHLRKCLHLRGVAPNQNVWTKQECLRILRAVCEVTPEHAHIPTGVPLRIRCP